MSLFGFLKSRSTAPVARERLQILLAHERVALGPRDLVAILRDELIATIARHIEFDPEKLSVKMERSSSVSRSTWRFPATRSPQRVRAAPPGDRRQRPRELQRSWRNPPVGRPARS